MSHLFPKSDKYLLHTSIREQEASIILSLDKIYYLLSVTMPLAHFDRSLNTMRVKHTLPHARCHYLVRKRQLYDSSECSREAGKIVKREIYKSVYTYIDAVHMVECSRERTYEMYNWRITSPLINPKLILS